MGIKGVKPKELNQLQNGNKTRAQVQPIPVNKLGDYCEGKDGNITLLVEYNNVKTLAILDNGAGIAIATKSLWEAWGKLAIKRTRMKLQLFDGYIKSPIGLIEKIIVTSCGIEYKHTFAMVEKL